MSNNARILEPLNQCIDLVKELACFPSRAENRLHKCDYKTINTICLVMIAGRDCFYDGRFPESGILKKEQADAYLNRLSNHVGSLLVSDDEEKREGDIAYITGKVDLGRFLSYGLTFLGYGNVLTNPVC